MKRATLIAILCSLILSSCSAEAIETGTVTEAATEKEVEAEEAKDPYFGLTREECEYVVEKARSMNIPCSGIEDFADISCTGRYWVIRAPSDCRTDYDHVEYGALTKSGIPVPIKVPVSLLEKWGIDVASRIKR